MAAKNPRRLHVRTDPVWTSAVSRAAHRRGVTVSEFVRLAAERAAYAILAGEAAR